MGQQAERSVMHWLIVVGGGKEDMWVTPRIGGGCATNQTGAFEGEAGLQQRMREKKKIHMGVGVPGIWNRKR